MSKDLIRGDSGPRATALQQALRAAGDELRADGQLGAKSEVALKSYQQRKGLLQTGIGDGPTRATLAADLLEICAELLG